MGWLTGANIKLQTLRGNAELLSSAKVSRYFSFLFSVTKKSMPRQIEQLGPVLNVFPGNLHFISRIVEAG
jgi:hypothetical protein